MIVLAPFSSTVTKKAKQEAWETVRTQLNGVGANIGRAKLSETFCGRIFVALYLQKVSESKKTGSGGSGELNELDETVLDILGREKANIELVKVEDSDIVFGEEIIVTTTPSAEGKITVIPM